MSMVPGQEVAKLARRAHELTVPRARWSPTWTGPAWASASSWTGRPRWVCTGSPLRRCPSC